MNEAEYVAYLEKQTLQSLQDIVDNLDQEQQPERYQALQNEIKKRSHSTHVVTAEDEQTTNPSNEKFDSQLLSDDLTLIFKGLTGVLKNFKSLCKTLTIPVIIIVIINYLATDSEPKTIEDLTTFTYITLIVCSVLMHSLVAVTIHKFILQGQESMPAWGINKVGVRELKYAGLVTLMAIVPFLPMFITAFSLATLNPILIFILTLTIIVFGFVALYCIARISLVLPSIAIGSNLSLKDSWDITENKRVLMIVCVIILPLLLSTITKFLFDGVNLSLLTSLIQIITPMITISVLSHAYKLLVIETPTDH